MLEVTKEEIEQGWKLLNEGKEEEALIIFSKPSSTSSLLTLDLI